MDLFDVEAVEMQLDRIMERRAVEARDTERVEELWKESTRAHRERRQEANRVAWRCFYLEQAERLERTAAELAASHRARAARLGEVS